MSGAYKHGRLIEHYDKRFIPVWRDLLEICERRIDAEILDRLEHELLIRLAGSDDDAWQEQFEVLNGDTPESCAPELWVELSEAELCKRLGGYSDRTVRDALRRLEDRRFLARRRQAVYEPYSLLVRIGAVNQALGLASGNVRSIGRITERNGNTSGWGGRSADRPGESSVQAGQSFSERGEMLPRDRDVSSAHIDRKETVETDKTGGDALTSLPTVELGISQGLLKASQIPTSLHAIDLSALFRDEPSYAAAAAVARVWAEDCSRPLILAGPAGAGKTTIAAAASWVLLGRGLPLLWLQASEATRLIDHGDFQDDRRRRLLLALGESSALVIDDLDQALGKQAAASLSAALAERLLAQVPVLITTDLAPAELEAALGEKTHSRLLATGAYAELQGPNLHKLRRAS